VKNKKKFKKKKLTFFSLQNFKVKHGSARAFKREIKERDKERESPLFFFFEPFFFYSLSLSLSLSSRGKREKERELLHFFFPILSQKKKKYARTQTRAPERVTRDHPGRARRARGETSESASEI
jgi:hypothetical protein